jgi:hypothetical protein
MKAWWFGFGLLLGFAIGCAHGAQSVTLAWNANTETNLAGYRLYYGGGTRAYTGNVTVPVPMTTATVTNLQAGVAYFFAVTAFTDDWLESDYSDEVTYLVPLPLVTITITLEEACDPNGPWEALTNSILVALPVDSRFYRARLEAMR